MRTSWEKIVQYIGTTYGQDISNELQNKIPFILAEPTYSTAIMHRHTARETVMRTSQANLLAAREKQVFILEAQVATNNLEAPMK